MAEWLYKLASFVEKEQKGGKTGSDLTGNGCKTKWTRHYNTNWLTENVTDVLFS